MSKTPTPAPSTDWVTDSVNDNAPVPVPTAPLKVAPTPVSKDPVVEDETGAARVPANWALHREDGKLHALNLVTRQKYVGDVAGFNKLLRGE